MSRNTIISAAVRSILISSAVAAVGFPTLALSQEEGELEEIVVTGSLIPLDLNTPGIPVTVMTQDALESTAATGDLLNTLLKSQPFFFGGTNIGRNNGNISSGSTNGGSQIALRDLPTLVLINGRRVAVSPVTAVGGYNFVDVSMIPQSAVERIEILSDGASATYGSDAVGGVVNVILKTDFEGAEVGAHYGTTENGDWTEKSYYGVFGASGDKGNITISTEWKKSDPLMQGDRKWAGPQYGTTTFAGSTSIRDPDGSICGTACYYYLNPSLNSPFDDPRVVRGQHYTPEQLVEWGVYSGPNTASQQTLLFDLARAPTMIIAKELRSFLSSMDYKLNETTTLFGDFMYANTTTASQLNAQPVTATIAADDPNNPFNLAMTGRNRFVEYPRIYATENHALRGVIGVRGDIVGSWKYEVGGNFNRIESNYRNFNLVIGAGLANGLNPDDPAQQLYMFDRTNSATAISGILGTNFQDFVSSLDALDARVYGDLFELPGGAIQLAMGAETRQERLSMTNDALDQTGGFNGATPTQPFKARSGVDGYYAELRIPIFSDKNAVTGFQALDLSIAGRKEVYDSTKDPFVPKFALRWQPVKGLTVRGTYSESFTAPTLYELYGPAGVGYTPEVEINRYNPDGTPILDGNGDPVTTGSTQFRGRSGSNPELDPAESKNWTVGLVWNPDGALRGLEVSLDWWDIKQEKIVGTIDSGVIAQSVERYGPASPYASLVRFGVQDANEVYFDTGTLATAPGQVSSRQPDTVWLTATNLNLGGIEEDGLDLRVTYAYDTTDIGTFSGSLAATYLNSYKDATVPGEPIIDYAGSWNLGVYADWRAFLQLGWTKDAWAVGLNGQFIPSMNDYGYASQGDYDHPKIDSYMQWDLRVGFDFSKLDNEYTNGLAVNLGVNNLFDEELPYIETEGDQSHDVGSYDPFGRLFYAELSYKF